MCCTHLQVVLRTWTFSFIELRLLDLWLQSSIKLHVIFLWDQVELLAEVVDMKVNNLTLHGSILVAIS